jgi:hypothetical protein
MQACLEAPADELARMGTAARARVLARHDVDRSAGVLVGEIEGTLGHALQQEKDEHECL